MPKNSSCILSTAATAVAWAAVCAVIAMAARVAIANPTLFACSPDRVVVPLGGSVVLRAWAHSGGGIERGDAGRYEWDVRVGHIEGKGAEVRWVLSGVRAGRYAAGVRLRHQRGPSTEECIVRVIVAPAVAARAPAGGLTDRPPLSPPPATRPRETGGALLLPNQPEALGYGLYSYLLFGAPPAEEARERYVSAIQAYLGLIPDIAALEQYVPPSELNIAYVPVHTTPDRQTPPDRMLADYDYARARSLLRLFPGAHRDGPYIVSSLRPLGGAVQPTATPNPYLFQDLSNVPPHLVASWIKEFLNQAAQERFWEDRSAERFALKLRMTVGILATALPEVKKALDTWIAWVR